MDESYTGEYEDLGSYIEDTWGLSQIWNRSLMEREERPIVARDNIWASELGKSYAEVFLKMKGELPTNPPNMRSLRKFEAGNVFEWIVGLILKRAGILQGGQDRVVTNYEGLLQVTGRLDFLAGGMPDYEKANAEFEALDLPNVFKRGGLKIIKYLAEKFPAGLDTQVLEVKSLSAFMFDGIMANKKTLKLHRLQCFHYLKGLNKPRGMVIYICRDDMRMIEIPIYNNEETEAEYLKELKAISGYIQRDEMPPLELPIVFDEDLGKFSKNYKIAYCLYLTKLYGFKDQAEFDDKYSSTAERWNRVLGRIKKGEKMTENNLGAIAEIEEAGFDMEYIKSLIIK